KIRRHEKGEHRRVVTGPKRGANQADWLHRKTIAASSNGIGLNLGSALESIRALAGFALLLAEGLQRAKDRCAPERIERRCVAGAFPVMISQPDRVAERIHLPFAFVDSGFHVGMVALPLADLFLVLVEGISIGILQDAARVTV